MVGRFEEKVGPKTMGKDTALKDGLGEFIVDRAHYEEYEKLAKEGEADAKLQNPLPEGVEMAIGDRREALIKVMEERFVDGLETFDYTGVDRDHNLDDLKIVQ